MICSKKVTKLADMTVSFKNTTTVFYSMNPDLPHHPEMLPKQCQITVSVQNDIIMDTKFCYSIFPTPAVIHPPVLHLTLLYVSNVKCPTLPVMNL
jgi:hypothetical protein